VDPQAEPREQFCTLLPPYDANTGVLVWVGADGVRRYPGVASPALSIADMQVHLARVMLAKFHLKFYRTGAFPQSVVPGKDQPEVLGAPSTPTSPERTELGTDKASHAESENNPQKGGSSCKARKLSSPQYYFISNFRCTHRDRHCSFGE
jgi:hypothetical protein